LQYFISPKRYRKKYRKIIAYDIKSTGGPIIKTPTEEKGKRRNI
jgi:hypothetical protein